ncbi:MULTISPECIES: hypothetical protein [unclassified Acidovorax]|uniref:hypothetical protein n=1 Tax=unclassified Acidovorax TaxID=2684926 RepID=UPI00234B796E|nr:MULTISPECIES: hypothetical protein [unclassified Acidovorax]WCM98407.1 hypothetical protein M5C96_02800 [Acidovorax sp. GBBC 1281]GKS96471.1 hypothetical protein AVAK2825_18070 [Acidovorax sp. SUPP2825]GKT14112.1 hypothetical protein AVHY2522_03425 [Acidovorax sp. SUPP2522]
MKTKHLLFLGLLALLATVFLLFFYLKSHSGIESMIPSGRCVKSAYSDDDRKDRVSVNCQDYNGEVYTIILSKIDDKRDSDNVLANLKNGEKIGEFFCSNFGNPRSKSSENKINQLQACFSEKHSIFIVSTSRDAVLFFINQLKD